MLGYSNKIIVVAKFKTIYSHTNHLGYHKLFMHTIQPCPPIVVATHSAYDLVSV